MAGPSRADLPANQFRRAAKIDETVLLRLAFCFCQGISVAAAARSVGLSAKSVRSLYLDFRQRLTKPKFNRWHAAYQRLPGAVSLDQEVLVRVAFIDVLADCYLNTTCHRNFSLGNRKTRLCRACLLPKRFASPDRVDEALAVIDSVHAFYGTLGIKGESSRDPVSLFRLRLIHTATIATARTESGPLHIGATPGEMDPSNAPFRSVWRLLDILLTDLADQPK